MSVEFRDKWQCATILHGGGGPETEAWRTIKSPRTDGGIRADEAAEIYARWIFEASPDDYCDEFCRLFVAVQLEPGVAKIFCCRPKHKVEVMVSYDRLARDLAAEPRKE